jgi:hypothetical protein
VKLKSFATPALSPPINWFERRFEYARYRQMRVLGLFGRPNIVELKARSDVDELVKALHFPDDHNICALVYHTGIDQHNRGNLQSGYR